MKRLSLATVLALLALFGLSQRTTAEVSFGLSIDDEGLKGFYLAIGDHYKVKEMEIVYVRKNKLPDEEMPVLFFLTDRCGLSAKAIIGQRTKGKSWMEITLNCGHDASIFYVPVKRQHGPPYGKAYGHFKKHNKKQWKKVRLTDLDIINFVNLKFISDHYGYSPDEVIKMRTGGRDFISINSEVKKRKAGKKEKAISHKKGKNKSKMPSKPKGKGKG